jgi:hypothetical protein
MNIRDKVFEALEKANNDILLADGVFDIYKQEHIEILREYLIDDGIDSSFVTEYLNSVVEGRFPERQAYNANGILVTFPSPEYKQRAIQRGTHFEENPRKGQANIFTDEQPQDNQTGQEVEYEPEQEQPVQQPQQTTEPQKTDGESRSEKEKESDAVAIEKMLTTEFTLEEAIRNGFYYKKNLWYDSEGKYIGRLWNVNGKQIILNK